MGLCSGSVTRWQLRTASDFDGKRDAGFVYQNTSNAQVNVDCYYRPREAVNDGTDEQN
jgi:hypothetical protein